jgi:hypothetical protein
VHPGRKASDCLRRLSLLDVQNVESCLLEVNGGGEAGRAGADENDVMREAALRQMAAWP